MITQKVFFVHIPKTAGSTITAAVRDHFCSTQVCPYYHRAHLDAENLQMLPQWDFFWGHLPVSILNYIETPFIFTFLREPVERMLSEYHYITTSREEILAQNCQTWANPLLEFYAGHSFEEVADTRSLIDIRLNFQTLWLADCLTNFANIGAASKVNFRDALHRARAFVDKLDMVGLVERMDVSLVLLSDKLRVPLLEIKNSLKVNKQRPEEGWKTQFSELEPRLRKMAVFDYKIYAKAKKRLESEWKRFCKRAGIKHAESLNPANLDKIRDYLSRSALNEQPTP